MVSVDVQTQEDRSLRTGRGYLVSLIFKIYDADIENHYSISTLRNLYIDLQVIT